MTKGVRTPLPDEARAALVADYRAGTGINALRAKYGCGQARVVGILEAAGVRRRTHPAAARAKAGVPRLDVDARSPGLGRAPTAEEWGYLAGIFDAEGYLGYASGGRYYRLAIVQKADSGLLEWLVATLGAGRIGGSLGGTYRDVGTFHLEAQRAIFAFCCGVQPLALVKRPRVLEVIAAGQQKYGWSPPGG